ncbi:sensor histidine kinase [Gordonia sp. NPDC003376]
MVRTGVDGVRAQVGMRLILAVFLVLVIACDPPEQFLAVTWAVVGVYLGWTASTLLLARRPDPRVQEWAWAALFVDLAALTAVAVLAARSDATSWTSDVLLTGFALIPMAAATGLRPGVCVTIAIPTTVVFLVASAAARPANGEPWSSVLLHTLVIGGLGVGSVALSAIARSRVDTIAALARDRAQLLDDVSTIDRRARRELADHLHDGALQYVLAARGDVAAARRGDGEAIDRIEAALRESGDLLRSTLTALNPAVLDHHGLGVAVTELGRSTAVSTGLTVIVDTAAWRERPTPADELLYATARELLTNAVKHAHATRIELTLEYEHEDAADLDAADFDAVAFDPADPDPADPDPADPTFDRDGYSAGRATQGPGKARLIVVDDGVGIPPGELEPGRLTARLAEGHLGLASRQVRLAAAGGTLTFAPRSSGGTVAIATIPVVG